MSSWDAVVVGAGVSGLAAARVLVDAGCSVVVLDKARRPGGRCATRRTQADKGAPWFDFGAQYFTQRDDRFKQALRPLLECGALRPWGGRLAAMTEKGVLVPCVGSTPRYVGVGGMNRLARGLADDLTAAGAQLRTRCRAQKVVYKRCQWVVCDEREGVFLAPRLVVALPGPQAQELLGGYFPSECLSEMSPCLSVVARVSAQLPYDGLFMNDEVLDWAANNNSKPGHPGGGADLWTLHAQPGFSASVVASGDVEGAQQVVLAAFSRKLALNCVDPVAAHLWRNARPAAAEGPGFHLNSGMGLALCGDWLGGGRVEGAWLSGGSAGRALVASIQG